MRLRGTGTSLLIRLIAVTMLGGAAGCSPVQRLYAGKPLPVADFCRVYNTEQVEVDDVDGRAAPRPYGTDVAQLVYEFPPGRHRVRVEPIDKVGPGDDSGATFDYDFRGGHSYSFVTSELRGPGRRDWRVVLADYHTGQFVTTPQSGQGLHDARPLLGLP